MKRFYKNADVAAAADGKGFAIHLDGRDVKTPAKAALLVPTRRLAEAVAAEWEAQDGEIMPASMPLTQIISTQIDKIESGDRLALEAQVLRYFNTDLLFYRTSYPEKVGEAQAAVWDPVLGQFENIYGVQLETTTSLVALEQPGRALELVAKAIVDMDVARFTVMQIVTPLCGSVITGLLFTLGYLTPDDVMQIARVEERYKDAIYDVEKYGPDPSLAKSDAAMMRDLKATALYLELLAAE
jgi:chaperone required for assembly of F1-ATPase